MNRMPKIMSIVLPTAIVGALAVILLFVNLSCYTGPDTSGDEFLFIHPETMTYFTDDFHRRTLSYDDSGMTEYITAYLNNHVGSNTAFTINSVNITDHLLTWDVSYDLAAILLPEDIFPAEDHIISAATAIIDDLGGGSLLPFEYDGLGILYTDHPVSGDSLKEKFNPSFSKKIDNVNICNDIMMCYMWYVCKDSSGQQGFFATGSVRIPAMEITGGVYDDSINEVFRQSIADELGTDGVTGYANARTLNIDGYLEPAVSVVVTEGSNEGTYVFGPYGLIE